MKVVWTDGNNIFVVSKSKTSNKKITDGSNLVLKVRVGVILISLISM